MSEFLFKSEFLALLMAQPIPYFRHGKVAIFILK